MSNILIVDDSRAVRNSLSELLTCEGHTCHKASGATEALKILNQSAIELAFCDVMMEEMQGLDFLEKIREEHSEVPIIMLSGNSSIDVAVRCLQLGASDFITKPIDMNRILVATRNGIEHSELKHENKQLKKKLNRTKGCTIIGDSPAIREVLEMIERVAQTDARVLITGENGTGKELAARLIHTSSHRAAKHFVEVNCAAIPSELIESELFGHEKGSFTGAMKQRKGKFEQAEGGTIFLDEIGDMSLSAQAKVLRALQENKISRVGSDSDITVNVRIIAATNKNLESEIEAHNFREDLYHRLSVICLHIPPLRERKEDIPLLIDYFMKTICEDQHRPICPIDPEAMAMLVERPWRGNIRELRNCIERLVILCHNCTSITVKDVKKFCH